MSEKKRIFGMSEADKARLLQSLCKDSKPAPSPQRRLTHEVSPAFTRFDTLPVYAQVQVQKAVAQKLGVAQPYYVCHDGLSQAYAHIDGRRYLNFSCYDYLGLNGDARLCEAVSASARRYGISASASRLTAGERPPHRHLEQKLANLCGTEDALVFVSGHATNVSVIASLFGPQDVVFSDSASHNSLVLGATLSGAARFVFPNNDLAALRRLLEQHRSSFQRALIVTEGLFGMDGVICQLPDLVLLKKEFSCFLMVDEAHSMGTLGEHGFGVREHFGLSAESVDIWMGTLSKTFCGCGGYIAGTAVLTEILKYHAPGYVYSVGLPPLLATASATALDLMVAEPWRVQALQKISHYMLTSAQQAGLDTGRADGYAVIPIMIGDSLSAVVLSELLKEQGVLSLPIIYPGVEEGRARLRFFLSALHTREQIDQAIEATVRLLPRAREQAHSFAE